MNAVYNNLHPSMQVIDSTKIKSFQTCPRKFFFEHVLGWRRQNSDHDLWYGQAVHYAFEHMYSRWKERNKSGYTQRDVAEGFQKFLDHYRLKFSADTDIQHSAKSPENTLIMLLNYAENYKNDDFKVLETEISGSVAIGETPDGQIKRIFFRLDTVCEGDRGVFILEHKTSKWDPALWRASWTFDPQMGTGNHLLYSLYGDKTDCLRLNGIFLKAPLKTKDSETCSFTRVPMRWSGRKMQDWLVGVKYEWDEIHLELERLSKCSEGDPVMTAFPRNPNGCMKFNRVCEYMDYCSSYHNPLQHTELPDGFDEVFWDPREQDRDYTKVVEV